MIRPAVLSDRTRVVQLLKASRDAAGFDSAEGLTGFNFPFDPAYADRLFRAHLDQPLACCFVLDSGGEAQGVLMAVITEHPFGPVLIARETLWFIDPTHRGSGAMRMLDAYERWAASHNCNFIGMAGMGVDPAVSNLYKRRGYRVAETHFLKVC